MLFLFLDFSHPCSIALACLPIHEPVSHWFNYSDFLVCKTILTQATEPTWHASLPPSSSAVPSYYHSQAHCPSATWSPGVLETQSTSTHDLRASALLVLRAMLFLQTFAWWTAPPSLHLLWSLHEDDHLFNMQLPPPPAPATCDPNVCFFHIPCDLQTPYTIFLFNVLFVHCCFFLGT